MSAFERVLRAARRTPRKVVLPESTDVRVLQAAHHVLADAIAEPILLGNPQTIASTAAANNINLSGVSIQDPDKHDHREKYQQALFEKRKHKGMTLDKASVALNDRVTFACMMVNQGDADACVAGAITPTAAVVSSAMRYVGKHPEAKLVSSCFIMLTQAHHPVPDVMVIGDCALVIDPDVDELAAIASATGDTSIQLLDLEPEVAMLSFSTAGSARHAAVSKVAQATDRLRLLRPDWRIVGEVQLDAAVIPSILASKAPDQARATPCNVLIFPDLNAGNIGYKLIERFGGAQAIGPILQGLDHPVNDLSRGCSTSDIISIIAVSAAQVRH